MKKYITPSITGQDGRNFIAPAMAVVGLSKAAAFAIGAAAGLVAAAVSGDKSVNVDFPSGLEPCID